jgi:1-phosphatidylinositol-4-phosphate 5-kinase
LSLDKNRDSVFRAGEGTGRSGSFFFFSYDRRFIIKTLQGKEKDVLVSMLEGFVNHLHQTNGKTLLAKVYGLYTIKTNVFDPLDIMLM